MDNQVVYGLLGNGLNVIIAPLKETMAVSTWVFAHGGSDYETRENNGVHHFLEHMYFAGTKKRKHTYDIWSTIEGSGGAMNAQTERQVVGYGTVMNYNKLELSLEVIADILFHSRFDEQDIEKEKGIIIEEKRGSDDVSQELIYELWDEHLFPNCPWGFPIIGSEENIRGMTRDSLVSCMQGHYRSNSMVLAIAGMVDVQETMALANKYFSKARRGKKLTRVNGFKHAGCPQMHLHFKETQETHLVLGVRNNYHLFNPLKCAFELLGIILGGNSSSRLFNLVRSEKGLAYDIRTHNSIYTNRADLGTYAGVNHDNLEQVIKLIVQEYRKTAANGVTQCELDLAKEYILGSMVRGLEDSSSLAATLALKKLMLEPYPTPQQEMDAVKKVTLEEVNQVAQDIFRNGKMNLVVLGPHKNQKQLEKLLKP